ncbi:MAG: hypothetical protein HYV27_18660 [Candidatus Hydrogenedentes bacterium]|nr:hypothetical protein [Candidatus Hydrogenedentota bacterium]
MPVHSALTANAIEGDRQKCLDAGMNGCISRPMRPQQLSGAIRKWNTPNGA